MDAQALQAAGHNHQELRQLAKGLGLRNSFLGCNKQTLASIAALRQKGHRKIVAPGAADANAARRAVFCIAFSAARVKGAV